MVGMEWKRVPDTIEDYEVENSEVVFDKSIGHCGYKHCHPRDSDASLIKFNRATFLYFISSGELRPC